VTEPYTTSIEINAAPERVFDYFTDPHLLLCWMGDYAVLDPHSGGQFTLDINGVPVRGRYLTVDPPHRLVIAWGHAGSTHLPPGASTLELTLTATPTGTLVDLVHHGLPPGERDAHAIGWPHFLQRLTLAATGIDPGTDPFAATSLPSTGPDTSSTSLPTGT
jgi:uncharacterized protein YndB with AHSA1/START domain